MQSNNKAILDAEGLISNLGGDVELFMEIMDEFLDDVIMRVGIIKKALETKNFSDLKGEGHTIKGLAGNMKAMIVSDIGEKIMSLSRAENIEEIEPLVPLLSTEIEKVKQLYDNWKKEQ